MTPSNVVCLKCGSISLSEPTRAAEEPSADEAGRRPPLGSGRMTTGTLEVGSILADRMVMNRSPLPTPLSKIRMLFRWVRRARINSCPSRCSALGWWGQFGADHLQRHQAIELDEAGPSVTLKGDPTAALCHLPGTGAREDEERGRYRILPEVSDHPRKAGEDPPVAKVPRCPANDSLAQFGGSCISQTVNVSLPSGSYFHWSQMSFRFYGCSGLLSWSGSPGPHLGRVRSW
jgi:hypothetical protein